MGYTEFPDIEPKKMHLLTNKTSEFRSFSTQSKTVSRQYRGGFLEPKVTGFWTLDLFGPKPDGTPCMYPVTMGSDKMEQYPDLVMDPVP